MYIKELRERIQSVNVWSVLKNDMPRSNYAIANRYSNHDSLDNCKLPRQDNERFTYPCLIGEGVHGYAFDCGNDIVLKVTFDINEYKTAQKLKEEKLEGIVKIYDCFEINEEEDTYYCILEEKLDTQNIDIADFILEFRHAWFLHKYNNKTINEAYRNKSEMINVVRNSISKKHISKYDCFSNILKKLLEEVPLCEPDIQASNFGLNSLGKITLFDIQ